MAKGYIVCDFQYQYSSSTDTCQKEYYQLSGTTDQRSCSNGEKIIRGLEKHYISNALVITDGDKGNILNRNKKRLARREQFVDDRLVDDSPVSLS